MRVRGFGAADVPLDPCERFDCVQLIAVDNICITVDAKMVKGYVTTTIGFDENNQAHLQFRPPPSAAVMLAAPAVQNTHVKKKTMECAATLVRTLPVDAE